MTTMLKAGQVAIVQVDVEDGDDPHINGTQNMDRDTISFVLLAPVGQNTVIYFTDRAWSGSAFAAASGSAATHSGENTYTWTASADLPAGTVITITRNELTAAGISLSDTGETIYAYQGSNANTPTTFLFAIEVGDGNTTFNGNLTNTGLTNGVDAVTLAGDNVSFGGRTWNINTPVLLQNIVNPNNWHQNENSPQPDHVEGTNLHTAPDHMLWVAGISGGHGLIAISHDATQNGGIGYNQQHYFQNLGNDGNATTTTQRFWSPTHILFDTVQNKFFIVDSSGSFDRILQGNISDMLANPGVAPTMTILWQDSPAGTSDGDGITGMQIDKVNGHIYFTADNTLLRVNYNTANQTAVTLMNLGLDPDNGNKNWANEIALDLANGRVFIISTESFSDFQYVPSTWPGAMPDPSSPTGYVGVVTTMSQNSIHMVSNVASSDTNATGNTIVQLTFNAGYSENNSIATNTAQNNEFEDTLGKITDIDINTLTGEIWFTTVQLGLPGTPVGGIYKATLNAGTGALTVTTVYSETNATNQNFFHIHIDEETGHYYVSSVEPNQSGISSIYRGSLSAPANTAPTFYSSAGNVQSMGPRDMTLESAPTLVGTGNAGLAVTEASSAPNSGETARVALFSGVSASDIDTPNTGDELAGAVVRISSGFTYEAASTATGHAGTVDRLYINNATSGTIAGSGITFSYDQTTGMMILSGAATVAEYAAALQLVHFSTSGDNVTNDGNAPTRTISASVFDGLLYSDEINANVTVTGINDAPVNAPGAAMNFTEDTTGSTAGTPVNAITGISFGDADADATSELFTVTLSVTKGTLTIRTDVTGGLTAGQVAGNGTAALTLTGTQNAINATLAAVNASNQANGLVYTPIANYNGADTLTMITNDQGNNGNDPGTTGTGTSEADIDFKTINIAEVNDAPTVTAATQTAAAILEDTPHTNASAPTVATLFGGSFSDALDVQVNAATNPNGSPGDSFAGIAIVSATSNANGSWQYWTGSAWVNIGAGTQAAARTLTEGTQIRFNPVQDYNGPAPTLTVHLIEGGGPAITNNGTVNLSAVGATGGTTVYSAGTVVLSQSITAVNDAPVNTVGGTLAINEDASATALTGISIADVDALPGSLMSVTLNVENGTLAIRTNVAGGIVPADIIAQNGSTIVLSATIAKINTTLAAANGLTYIPNANFNGADRLRVSTNDNGASGQDPGATGTETSEQDVDDKAITIASVNDAPSGADKTITAFEDARYTFTVADFGFSDPADGNSLQEVVITTLPGSGSLFLLSFMPMPPMGMQTIKTPVAAGQAIPVAQISSGFFVYEPAANGNGNNYATFTFQVRDNGGTANGGQNTDQSSNTITFDITAVNDAPVIANLQGDTATFTEQNGGGGRFPTPFDTGTNGAGNAAVTDVDSGNFDGGTLVVSITAGKNAAQDVIVFMPGGSVQVGNNNGILHFNQATGVTTLIGTANMAPTPAGSSAFSADGAAPVGQDATITFNANATPELVQDVLRAFAYFNTNRDAPTAGARTVSFTLTDGDGGTTAATTTMNVVAVNDAPSGANNNDTVLDNAVLTFTASDFSTGMTDPEGHGFAGVRISTLPTSGILRLDGTAITAGTDVSLAQLNANALTFTPSGPGAATPTFTFQVRDNGGTSWNGVDLDPTPRTFTVTVQASNAAPVANSDALTAVEDTPTTYQGSTLTANDTDPDNDALIVTAVSNPVNGSVVLNGGNPIFTPAANFNGTASFDYTVSDGKGGTSTATATVTVSAVNDAPVIANLGGDAHIQLEGRFDQANVLLDVNADAIVTDPDSGNFGGGSLTVRFVTPFNGGTSSTCSRTGISASTRAPAQ
jgi:hypothetical protein